MKKDSELSDKTLDDVLLHLGAVRSHLGALADAISDVCVGYVNATGLVYLLVLGLGEGKELRVSLPSLKEGETFLPKNFAISYYFEKETGDLIITNQAEGEKAVKHENRNNRLN